MVSPMADHGYDVADPRDIDPLFGGMAALERLIAAAHRAGHQDHDGPGAQPHQLGAPVVPGGAGRRPGQRRARPLHLPRRPRPRWRRMPPNNWVSVFGGPAWTRVVEPDGNPGQWYLHLFDAEQPDLNWDNPEVFDDLEKTLRFWLERGVDGFRIDVAHGMAKPPGLPDMEVIKAEVLLTDSDDDPRFNHDGVHEIHRGIRTVLDDYPDAVTIGEVWVFDNGSSGPSICAPTNCTWASISGWCEPNSTLPRSTTRSRTPWRPPRSKMPSRPGRCPTTMSNGGYPLRRRRDRAGPRARDGDGDARAAGRGIHLQRRGTRPAQRRLARRGAAGPDVGTLRAHRTRPRRVPGADAVVGRRSPVRVLRHRPTPGCRSRRSGRR